MNQITQRNSRKQRPVPITIDTMVMGKVPPQAKDLEQAVLGSIMMFPDTFHVVCEILKSDSFYVDAHQRIYRAMENLSQRLKPIDVLTVNEQLVATSELEMIGGPAYLGVVINRVTNPAHVESYCRIIHEKYLKREQIRICGEAILAAYEEESDAFENLDSLSSHVTQLATIGTSYQGQDVGSAAAERFKYLVEANGRESGVLGIPSGLPDIDRVTLGWMPGYLIILAARPSVGKTALALNLARNAAALGERPAHVAFWSLEMKVGDLMDRLLSAETGISFASIRRARLSESEFKGLYENGVQRLHRFDIYLEYRPGLNILELRAKAQKWKRRWIKQDPEGRGMIIIDYLQLMSGVRDNNTTGNREQELATISRSLKNLAGELNIPIIALSQLSRDIEKRGGGKPKLSDIRESGAIEQDGDVVAFLTREDYEQMEHEVDEALKNKAYVHIQKNRNGELERIPMCTALEIQRWMTPDQYDQYQRNLNANLF